MKLYKFILPLLAIVAVGCDDYLDINESPNQLTFDKALPSKLLPGAQVSLYRQQVGAWNQLGNVWMNSWTRNVASFGNGFDTELQLNITSGFSNNIWDTSARQIKNFQAIIDYPNPNGKYDYYVAAAKLGKAFYMQYFVDLFGNVPYSQAWQDIKNLTPAYDDDYAIYQDLIKSCADARNLIDNADPSVAEEMGSADVLLGGDMAKWIEFSNTLQLRLCLRMSNVTGARATYRNAKLAEIAGGPFLADDVAISPPFNGSNNDTASPAFNTYAIDAAGFARQNRTFITMTGHAYKSLQSYATTNWAAGQSREIVPGSGVNYPDVTDPRSARLFTAAPSQPRRAVTQGGSFVTVGAPTTTFPGLPCRLGLIGNFNPYALAPNQTLEEYASCPGYIMTKAESEFLQAEAAVRYPALFSGAQSHFDDGIRSNCDMKVVASAAYITTINTRPNFGLAASNTLNQRLHAIMYQKWVALMGQHGIESYIDYIRTGFPFTPLSTNATQTRKPYRLIYPVSEYIANSANVPNMTTADCFVINSLTPFWVLGAN